MELGAPARTHNNVRSAAAARTPPRADARARRGPRADHAHLSTRLFGRSRAPPRVLTLNSATSGLHLALHLLHKSDEDWPGLVENVDEVLTCPLTCTATNWPILANRLRIKWVDADPATANMCLDDLEAKLSPTTKVIMLVHWGGTPVDLNRVSRVQEICFQRFGFRPRVIEDCAHAIGAEHRGRSSATTATCASSRCRRSSTSPRSTAASSSAPQRAVRARQALRWFGIDRNKRSGAGDFRMEPTSASTASSST